MPNEAQTTRDASGHVGSTAELGADNLNFEGRPVPRNCENCEGLFDDGDGPEYGPPQPACSIKPKMAYLKPFPFTTSQKCFRIAWWHLVDWDEEGRKMDAEYRASQAPNTEFSEPAR